MFRSTKRQRMEFPTSWMDCETILNVPSPFEETMIRSQLASELTKELFMERFQKEIVDQFHYSLSSQLQIDPNQSVDDAKRRRKLLQQRVPVGIHVCIKILEDSVYRGAPVPGLVVVAAQALPIPPIVATQLVVLACQLHVPLLMLPGTETGSSLGAVLGVKRASTIAFMPQTTKARTEDDIAVHSAIDSLVKFLKEKVSA